MAESLNDAVFKPFLIELFIRLLGWVGLDFSNSVRVGSVFNPKYPVSVFEHHRNEIVINTRSW